ncbi:MAG: efflux RND transporter periplasmic adaptor subunit [Alphaproteobacteria bacterium]
MKYLRIIFLLLIAVAVISMFTLFSGEDKETLRFRTAVAERGDISQVVTAVGTLNPIEMVSVGTRVSGQITNMYVEVSDEVKKGQLLAEIDPAIPEAQLKQSRNSLEISRISMEQAGRDLNRTRALVAKEYVARVDLEQAEQSYLSAKSSYESAVAQVERDEVNLSYTKITSPINGVIIAQEVTKGQTLASDFQTPNLFKIAGDLAQMKIEVKFSEADISHVKTGLPVKFTVDAFPDKEFTGVVDMVNLNPDTTSGSGVTYAVIVTVENKEKKLLPGMTAYVSVILSEKKDVLRVPAAALRFSPPQEESGGFSRLFSGGGMSFRQRDQERKTTSKEFNSTLYVLKNGQPEVVDVSTGATDEIYIEIKGGTLKQGDQVITGIVPTFSK